MICLPLPLLVLAGLLPLTAQQNIAEPAEAEAAEPLEPHAVETDANVEETTIVDLSNSQDPVTLPDPDAGEEPLQLADPVAQVEAWLEELPQRFYMLAEIQSGLYAPGPWMRPSQIKAASNRVRQIWHALALDPAVEILPEAELADNHAVVIITAENPHDPTGPALLWPLCLLSDEEGNWRLSPGLSDFGNSSLALDSDSRKRAVATLARAETRIAAEIDQISARRIEQRTERIATAVTTYPEDPTALLRLAAEHLSHEQLPEAESFDGLRALLFSQRQAKPEAVPTGWVADAWTALDAFPSDTPVRQAYRTCLIGEPEEHAGGEEWRVPVLLEPLGTAGELAVGALYLLRSGENWEVSFEPRQFTSLRRQTGIRPNQDPEAHHEADALFQDLVVQATQLPNSERDPASEDPAAIVDELLAALRSGDYAHALTLSHHRLDREESELLISARQLLASFDFIRRQLLGPMAREIHRPESGEIALFLVEGADRGFPFRSASQPLGLRRLESGWAVDQTLLANPELAAIVRSEQPQGSSRQLFDDRVIPLLEEGDNELPPVPDAAAKITTDAGPAKLWHDFNEAWQANDLARLSDLFILGGNAGAAAEDLNLLCQFIGHPTFPIALRASHRSGDWAALTFSYQLAEGNVALSLLAARQDDSNWALVLPSLQAATTGELPLLRGIVAAWNGEMNADDPDTGRFFQQLRQPGLEPLLID